MGKREKLLQQAINGPASMRFEDLCKLAELFGFEMKGGAGSHRVYKRDGFPRMVFQDDGGKAKPYQVKQLLEALRDMGEVDDQ